MGGKTEEGEMMMKFFRLESKCGLVASGKSRLRCWQGPDDHGWEWALPGNGSGSSKGLKQGEGQDLRPLQLFG